MSWLLRHSGRTDRRGYMASTDVAAFLNVSEAVVQARQRKHCKTGAENHTLFAGAGRQRQQGPDGDE